MEFSAYSGLVRFCSKQLRFVGLASDGRFHVISRLHSSQNLQESSRISCSKSASRLVEAFFWHFKSYGVDFLVIVREHDLLKYLFIGLVVTFTGKLFETFFVKCNLFVF